MTVRHVTQDDLRRMRGREALVVQGCGGDLQDWVDGINGWLARDGVLLDGTRFRDALDFQNGGVVNLVLPLDSVSVDLARLAGWRLRTYDELGGTWLSEYVPEYLGGFVSGAPAPARASARGRRRRWPAEVPDAPPARSATRSTGWATPSSA